MEAPPLRPSTIKEFWRCHRSFDLTRRNVSPHSRPGRAATLGTFVHDALDLFYALNPEHRYPDLLDASLRNTRKKAQRGRGQLGSEYLGLNMGERTERAFHWEARDLAHAVYDIENPRTVTAVERELTMTGSISGVPMQGTVDRIDRTEQGLVVVDYKTGTVPAQHRREAELRQGVYYALLYAQRSGGEIPRQVRFLYLRYKRELTLDIDHRTIEWAQQRVVQTADTIGRCEQRDDWPPLPQPLCGWCAHLEVCPEGSARYERRG